MKYLLPVFLLGCPFFFSFKFFLHILDKGPSIVTCVAKNLLGGISNVQISQFGKDLGGKKKRNLCTFPKLPAPGQASVLEGSMERKVYNLRSISTAPE